MAVVTSEFGKRKRPCPTCSEDHGGIDLRAPVGSPVYANKDLKISRIKDFGDSGYGKALYVKDPADPKKEYIFGHMDDNNPGNYKVGDTIPAGEIMAYTGATGVNGEPHVHYEVREDGVSIPPRPYTDIASFEKNSGNLLTTTARVDPNRPTKPTADKDKAAADKAAAEKKLKELKEQQDRKNKQTGPGSNTRPRPSGKDVGIILNPRHKLGDGD